MNKNDFPGIQGSSPELRVWREDPTRALGWARIYNFIFKGKFRDLLVKSLVMPWEG